MGMGKQEPGTAKDTQTYDTKGAGVYPSGTLRGNYETHITGDLDDAISALDGYGVTVEQVQEAYKSFYAYCCEHDMF